MQRLMNAVTAGIFAAMSLFAADAGAVTLSKAKPVKTTTDVTPVVIMKDPPVKYLRRVVTLVTTEKPGTIIVDTNHKYLYHVMENNKAMRYGIGVGREGFGWSGVVRVARKAEWPGWTPPKEMIVRERKAGHILPAYQEGGIDNPLGARALYLFGKKGDSGFRIHGTNQPWTIGLNMSSGCIRMMNKDVEHLYERTPVGTKVIVVGPGNRQGKVEFADQGVDYFRDLFASFER